MRAVGGRLGNQDGSALLISLMMIFIMTILGLALFDLGVIENRLTSADEADARALEMANAAVEQGYRVLTQFAITNNSLTGVGGANAVTYTASSSNQPFLGGGTYTLEYMLVTPNTVNGAPFGLPCLSSGGFVPLCNDMLLMRASGGTFADLTSGTLTTGASPSATYGRVRAVQVLVRAESLSPFAYAVTAESQGPNRIRGLIAGSVNMLACGTGSTFGTTCSPFGFDGSSDGMKNHYNDLSDAFTLSLGRLAALQNVCPTGSTCPPTSRVWSMGATLKVSGPTSTVAVRSGTDLGESANQGPYSHDGTSFSGKGTLDNVFVADGCVSSCTDNYDFTSAGTGMRVTDGNITKPYPRRPARNFPRLTDPVTVLATAYQHYACLTACGAETHFFTTHGGGGSIANPPTALSAGTTPTAFARGTVTAPPCESACPNLGTLFTSGDFENAPAFVHDFVFSDRVVGTAGTPSNREGRICWTGTAGSTVTNRQLLFARANTGAMPAIAAGVPNTQPSVATLQSGANCTANLASTTNPVLILISGNLRFGATGGGNPSCSALASGLASDQHCINYLGSAIFVVSGTVGIDAILQTRCNPTALTFLPPFFVPPAFCSGFKFPDNQMIAILSSGNMTVGTNKTGLDRVMAWLYTEGDFTSAGGNGGGSRNVIIGTVAAARFCFAQGCPGAGGNDETRLFQATLSNGQFPDELLPGRTRWTIAPLQKFWRECVPVTVTPTYTFGTGRCTY